MSDDVLAEIFGEIGQSARAVTSATIQAATTTAMERERKERIAAAELARVTHELERATHTARLAAGPDDNERHWVQAIDEGGGERVAQTVWTSKYWPEFASVLTELEQQGHDVISGLKNSADTGPGNNAIDLLSFRMSRYFTPEAASERYVKEQAQTEAAQRVAAGPDGDAHRWLSAVGEGGGSAVSQALWSSEKWPEFADYLQALEAEGHDVTKALREVTHRGDAYRPAETVGLVQHNLDNYFSEPAIAERHAAAEHAAQSAQRVAAGPDGDAHRWLSAVGEGGGTSVAQALWASEQWDGFADQLANLEAEGHDVTKALREVTHRGDAYRPAETVGLVQFKLMDYFSAPAIAAREQSAQSADRMSSETAARVAAGPDGDAHRWLSAVGEGGGDRVAQTLWSSEKWSEFADYLQTLEAQGHDVVSGLKEATHYRDAYKPAETIGLVQFKLGNYFSAPAIAERHAAAEAIAANEERWLSAIAAAGGDELAMRARNSPAYPALLKDLQRHEDLGRNAAEALTRVIPERDFKSANDVDIDNVAAILHHRVRKHFGEQSQDTQPRNKGAAWQQNPNARATVGRQPNKQRPQQPEQPFRPRLPERQQRQEKGR